MSLDESRRGGRNGRSEQNPRGVLPHGFDDDEKTRRLLRTRPPAPTLRWVEEVTGTSVLRTRALRGGRSSAVHLLHLRTVQTTLLRLVHSPPPDLPGVFIHRDFHPGNVLWRRGRVSGLVDWEAAALGPPVVDVAHCRVNLLEHGGLTAADRFTEAWERLSGLTHHPWADVVTIVDMLGGADPSPPREGTDFERALGRALAELGTPGAADLRRSGRPA